MTLLQTIFTIVFITIPTSLILMKDNKLGMIRNLLFPIIFPTPIFDNKVTKLINKIVKNTILEGVLSLNDEIKKRFGDLASIPIVLDISDNNWIKSVGTSSVYWENGDLAWCLNDKMAIVYANFSNVKNVAPILFHLFSGSAIHSIVFHFKSKEEQIQSICDFLFSITKNVVPVILVHDCDKMYLQSFAGFHNSEESVGFKIKNISNFHEELGNFLHEKIIKILNKSEIINHNFPKDLSYIQNLENEIFFNLSQVENSNMSIYGVFFICNNKLELKNQVLFYEDLYNFIVYSSCNDIQIIDKYSNEKRNSIFKIIWIISVISLILSSFFYIKSIKNIEEGMYNSVRIAENIIENRYVDDVQMLDHIKQINKSKIGFLVEKTASKEVLNLRHIRNFLITRSGKIFDKIQNVTSEDVFFYSPIELIPKLEDNISILIDAFEDIFNFVNNKNNSEIDSIKITEYKDIFKKKILSNFRSFAELFKKYIVIDLLEQLCANTKELIEDPSLESLKQILEIRDKLRPVLLTSTNSWWIEGILGKPYNKLIQKIEKIPNIGNSLSTEVQLICNNEIQRTKETILNKEEPFVGKILSFDNNVLTFSKGMQDFFNNCELLSQEELIQLPIDNMFYTIPEASEISLWELDVLDKIIQKIEEREDVIKGLKNYPPILKKIAIKLINKSMYDYIKSNLCNAQKIMPNSISIEEKAENIGAATESMNKIQHFIVKILNKNMPSFVDFLFSDSISKIVSEFKGILDTSLFTSYSKLPDWKGEDLILFLFQCGKEDLLLTVNKSINYLIYLKEKVLNKIINKLPQISKEDFLFIQNITNELEKYKNGRNNSIATFEIFINEISNWKIEWRDNIIGFSTKDDFFNCHLKNFRKYLILNTNRLIFKQSCEYYNKIATFFNEKIANRFPFGNKENANHLDIITFLEMYLQYRNHLKSDKEFQKLKLKAPLEYLDSLVNFFVIENHNLYINVKIQYHLPGGQNIYLIKEYISKLGEKRIKGDFIDEKIQAIHGFILGISIINSSDLKLKITNQDLSISLGEQMQFNFLDEYGFLYFIKHYLIEIKENEAILKITLPLLNKSKVKNDEIIAMIKVYNYPYFFYSMDPISS